MTYPDRVRLRMRVDAARLASEIEALELSDYLYYSVLPLTQPTPKPGVVVTDYADGSWADWHRTSWLTACPSIEAIVDELSDHTAVTLVRLLRLAPGSVVDEHTDPTLGLEQERSVIRLTIPITSNDEVALFLNDMIVPMVPGECWYLRFTDPHRVVNAGATERIHLSIDLQPNEWVRSWIGEALADAPTAPGP